MKRKEKSYTGWWFLLGAVLFSVIVFLIKPGAFGASLSFFWKIIQKMIFIFFFIFLLLV